MFGFQDTLLAHIHDPMQGQVVKAQPWMRPQPWDSTTPKTTALQHLTDILGSISG